MVHFNATLCIILTRPGGFTMPIKYKPFFWEVRNNKENTYICTYCLLLLMKPQGFGHNKRAYCCIMCGARALEVTQTNPLKANRALCSCLPVNALLFSATGPMGVGSVRRVNIHLGLTPETRRLLTEPAFITYAIDAQYWLHCFIQILIVVGYIYHLLLQIFYFNA